jgi:hypothetical protein
MRRWLVLMDAVLLITAALLLLVDLKIKEDLIAQATSLQRKIDGQRIQESDSNSDSVSPGVLRGNGPDNPAVEDQDIPEAPPKRARRSKGSSAPKPDSGNDDSGIPGQSE